VSRRRSLSLIDSFNYAIEGLIHVLRTHRNMRIHFAVAIAVLVAAVWKGVNRFELIALLLAITFVLVAEMINSAIEQTIDLSTTSFDPLAKLAKDIAAGAVLIAAINAIAIGYLVFSHAFSTSASSVLDRLRDLPLRGGLPSGHAAVAFAGWVAVTYILSPKEHRFLVSSIMFIMALLVAQTRIEAGVHSTLEVVYGGLLGALVALAVFQLFF